MNLWVFLSRGRTRVCFGDVFTLETTLKLVLVHSSLMLTPVCCQLGLWVNGACCATLKRAQSATKVTQSDTTFTRDFASKQRRRSDPRSGPLCPGTRAWLCCGWQHAGTVFFPQSELLWAKEIKLFTGNSCVWLAFTDPKLRCNSSATVYQDVC